MMNEYPEILKIIPQRAPFVMVDKILHAGDETCRTEFLIADTNILMDGNQFTEAGLVENIAQTAAAHAGYTALNKNEKVKTGFIGAITNLAISALPEIGDILQTIIKIENQIFDVTLISGEVSCGGRHIARCEMKIFLLPENKNTSQ